MNRFICNLILLAAAAVFSAPAQAGLAGAEYFLNTDPGPGNGIAIPAPAAGQPFAAQVPAGVIAALPNGTHFLVCRIADEEGNWSIAFARPFFKNDGDLNPEAAATGAEYFIGSDPGHGNGTPMEAPAGPWPGSLNAQVPPNVIAALANGTHALACRIRDTAGNWSISIARPFFKDDADLEPQALLARLELQWIRNAVVSGDPFSVTPLAAARELSFLETLNLTGFSTADYRLAITPIDTLGRIGIPASAPIRIQEARQLELGAVSVLEDGSIKLALAGASGLRLVVQTSTDLLEWFDLQTIEVTSDDAELILSADSAPVRFFRTSIP